MNILYLAAGVMGIIFLYLFGVTFIDLPDTGIDNAKTIVPFLLGTGLGTIIGFYFGASKEKEK